MDMPLGWMIFIQIGVSLIIYDVYKSFTNDKKIVCCRNACERCRTS